MFAFLKKQCSMLKLSEFMRMDSNKIQQPSGAENLHPWLAMSRKNRWLVADDPDEFEK